MLSGKIVPTLKKRKIPSYAGLGSYQLLRLALCQTLKIANQLNPGLLCYYSSLIQVLWDITVNYWKKGF